MSLRQCPPVAAATKEQVKQNTADPVARINQPGVTADAAADESVPRSRKSRRAVNRGSTPQPQVEPLI
ncbi:MAG: hypothetical protein AB7Q45_19980 [Planctomycetaceae bacterium]